MFFTGCFYRFCIFENYSCFRPWSDVNFTC